MQVLVAALPKAPSEMEGEADEAVGRPLERTTLDVSFNVGEDEVFGLWVAGLRALLAETRPKPLPYPAPFNPLHASAGAALRHAPPSDASRFERARDAALVCLDGYMQSRLFVGVTVVWVLLVVIFGAMYFFLLVGWHGLGQDEANELANASIQVLTLLFTYILSLTAPWRVGNAVHLWGTRRQSAAGLDLYGRPAQGIWWHIPPTQRKRIVALLMVNLSFQYLTQLCRIGWSSYTASQTVAGAVLINLTFVTSLLAGIGSGAYQGACEDAVRKASPGVFPPTPLAFALEAGKRRLKEAREEARALEVARQAAKGAQHGATKGARGGAAPAMAPAAPVVREVHPEGASPIPSSTEGPDGFIEVLPAAHDSTARPASTEELFGVAEPLHKCSMLTEVGVEAGVGTPPSPHKLPKTAAGRQAAALHALHAPAAADIPPEMGAEAAAQEAAVAEGLGVSYRSEELDEQSDLVRAEALQRAYLEAVRAREKSFDEEQADPKQ